MSRTANTPATDSIWLAPDVALAYFDPPEGIHQTAVRQAQQIQRARYGFRIGDLGLLIDPEAGSEVLAMLPLTTLPNTPPGFLGLINLRGNLIPVYELRTLLEINISAKSGSAKVLVFGKAEHAVGVLIDGYPVVLTALQPLPNLPVLSAELRKHVSTGYIQADTVWLEFNHTTFFAAISGSGATDPLHTVNN